MRTILTMLLLTWAYYASCQAEDATQYQYYKNVYGQKINRGWFPNLLRVPSINNGTTPAGKNAIAGDETGRHLWVWDGTGWNMASGGEDTLDAGPFTSVPSVNFNPGYHLTPTQIIMAAFYRAQPPTATLAGGSVLELMAAGSPVPVTLSWTAGRSSSTQPIKTITVAGVPQAFTQPGAGGSVSGTQVASVPRNTTTSFQVVVTTTDNQSVTVTTTTNFSPRVYYGWSSSATPTDADVLAGTSVLSSTIARSWTQPTSTGEKYFFYAYPASQGLLTKLDMDGLSAIGATVHTARPLTNASGFTQAYVIYVSTKLLDATKAFNVLTQ